jgi:predicted Zn-dependent protease with MMP-like domain
MTPEAFEELCHAQFAKLPPSIVEKLSNVDFVIEEKASRRQLREHGMRRGEDLLGLYEGVALVHRGVDYGGALPDKITVFREPHIRGAAEDGEDLATMVFETLMHEIGHHFGFEEDEILRLEAERRARRAAAAKP